MINKKNILNQIAKYLDKQIAQFEKNVAEFEAASDLDEGNVIDQEDLSFQSNTIEMKQHYKTMLQLAKFNKNKWEELKSVVTDRIIPGALVDTGTTLFYIGIPTSPLPFNDKKLLVGISVDSTLAKTMKTKKLNQSFKYGSSLLTIKGIY